MGCSGNSQELNCNLSSRTCQLSLEQNLQGKLDVERLARSDAWRVVTGTDGRPAGAERRTGAEVVVAQLRAGRTGQIHAVEEVIHLGAKLDVDREIVNIELGVLEHRKVEVLISRPE